jgi:hypothetical protein
VTTVYLWFGVIVLTFSGVVPLLADTIVLLLRRRKKARAK